MANGYEYKLMRITLVDELEYLTKDQLLEVATDRRNNKAIQDAALERWLMLDDKDFAESIGRLRQLVDTAKRLMRRSEDATAGHGS